MNYFETAIRLGTLGSVVIAIAGLAHGIRTYKRQTNALPRVHGAIRTDHVGVRATLVERESAESIKIWSIEAGPVER